MLNQKTQLALRFALFLVLILRGCVQSNSIIAQSWRLPLDTEFTEISLSNTSIVRDSQYLIYGKLQTQYKCLFVDDKGKIVQKTYPKKQGHLTTTADSGYLISTPQHGRNPYVIIESFDKFDNLRFSETVWMKPDDSWVQLRPLFVRELPDKKILLVTPKTISGIRAYNFVEIHILDEKGFAITSLEIDSIGLRFLRPEAISTLIDFKKQTLTLHDGSNLKRISYKNNQLAIINESKSTRYLDNLIADYPFQNKEALLFLNSLNLSGSGFSCCYRLTIIDMNSRILRSKDISFGNLELRVQTVFRDKDSGLWIFAQDGLTQPHGYIIKLNSNFSIERIDVMEISPLTVLRSPDGKPVIVQANSIYKWNQLNGKIIHTIMGKVVLSTDTSTCLGGSDRVPNAMISITGDINNYAITDSLGNFEFDVPSGKYIIKAINNIYNSNYSTPCFETALTLQEDKSETVNLTMVLRGAICPILNVQLSTPILRRCFKSTYFITCQNLGKTAKNAYVDLILDNFMLFDTSATPFKRMTDKHVRLFVGDLTAGQLKKLDFDIKLSCDARLGATHCIQSQAYADSCNAQINDNSTFQLSKNCLNGVLQFKAKNLKNTPLNANIRFIRNDTLLSNELLTLSPQSDMVKSLTAKGEVFRQEVRYNGQIWSQFEDGCGTANSSNSSNYSITHSPLNHPFQQIISSNNNFCISNRGSYDPNDKTGFPLGVGTKHFIEQNQELDYIIRFQNTGTDTAFKVVIQDVLDKNLEASTLRLGVSSHAYTTQWKGKDTISFIFDNILLPDSFVNEAKSHGFIRFKIAQKKDLPIGTILKNQAGIYFDFNEAVITNTTFHTLGKDFMPSIVSNINQLDALDYKVSIAPNPVVQSLNIIIDNENASDTYSVLIFDMLGRQVKRQYFNNKFININCENIENGIYLLEVRANNKNIKRQNIIIAN